MKKRFSILLAAVVFIFLTDAGVKACWCRKDPEAANTEEKFRKTVARLVDSTDFVFAGTPVEKTDTQLIFEVETVWKGNFKDEITFFVPQGFMDSCAFDFEPGKSYLVYANATIHGLSVNKCGRSNFLIEAGRDMDELNRQKLQAFNFGAKSDYFEPFDPHF